MDEMKEYIGTKQVKAAPCTKTETIKLLGHDIVSTDGGEDGYLVEYDTGYRSWCPKKQFDEANRSNGNFTFGDAIYLLKAGKKVCRAGWNGKGLSVELQVPDERSKMTLPYIFMNYPATPASDTAPSNHINARVPWLASQTDMMSEDWMVVD